MKALVLGALALVSQTDKPEAIGEWNLRIITDPMSDAVRGIASTGDANDLTVVVKCDSNGNDTLYISIISKSYLGGTSRNSRRDIGFRIDGAPAEKIVGYYDGRTANILTTKVGSDGGSFLTRLSNTSKLTLQVSDFDYKTYAAVIDTTGAKAAIRKVATACKDQAALAMIG